MPYSWYVDPEIAKLEQAAIFQGAWHLAAPGALVAEPGDQFATEVAGLPVVVIRDLEHKVRAFINVCRHRGFPLVHGQSKRQTIQCRYHAWTYALDGQLVTAPRSQNIDGFSRRDHGLVELASQVWNDLIFVNCDPRAPALDLTHPQLDSLAHEFNLLLEDYEFLSHSRRVISANWKAWIENASECYHCPAIHHSSLADALDVNPEKYAIHCVDKLIVQAAVPNDAAKRFQQGYSLSQIHIWPATYISVDDVIAFAGTVNAVSPARTELATYTFVRRTTSPHALKEWLAMYEETFAEDVAAVELQQKSFRAILPYASSVQPDVEPGVVHFQQLVQDALAHE